ncbi:hypothetical protein BACPLE_00606 [Phocaeicola plebeius DSM 17135]|uniref:Uncharacterized protein n=1 Tax=Phocaeicola plebeius (strain DSM 17135 / JCM 12973 / CCUG 54634 / M2) TaxID=484018 RepID=B5CV77_PHOPM|nr:hypothetical protein BACPLE_00606 [Phocaeicola plebeius DSM 17135]
MPYAEDLQTCKEDVPASSLFLCLRLMDPVSRKILCSWCFSF